MKTTEPSVMDARTFLPNQQQAAPPKAAPIGINGN